MTAHLVSDSDYKTSFHWQSTPQHPFAAGHLAILRKPAMPGIIGQFGARNIVLPIFLYGSEIWCLTSTLEKIGALDNWCLRRILHIHWTDFVSNDVVRSRTGQPLLSSVNGACPSLVICASPTSVKTTPEPSGPAFGVLPKTGDEELEDRGKPG